LDHRGLRSVDDGVVRNERWRQLLVVLALAGVVGALGWVLFKSGWEATSKLASAITAVIGVLVAVAKWWPRRGATVDANAALEALAVAVRRQWESEQTLRRLADPRPLPLRWVNCEHDGVMDYWEVISGVAGSETPIDLDGCLDEIVEVFERIPSRRLVVLGEPGAGKSVLAIQFIVATLCGRVAGDPVPVLFPVASWNPRDASLSMWMVSRLCVDYPFLGGRVASGATLAGDLVERGEIWPVLDGLDEAPEPIRAEMITALNRTLSAGDRMLLTCRSAEFVAAVEAAEDVVTAAAVIELTPLGLDEVASYLRVTAPTRRGVNKWEPIFTDLRAHPEDPLSAVLTTPLMTSLARVAYSEHAADPAVLLDRTRFATADSIGDHLLDQLVPAVYSAPTTQGRGWRAGGPGRWLSLLAADLNRLGTHDIAWWELYRGLPPTPFRLVSGVAVGLAAALGVALLAGVSLGVWFGFIAGFLVGFHPTSEPTPVRMRDRLARFTVAMVVGVLAAVVVAAVTYWEVSAHSAERAAALETAFGSARGVPWLFLEFGLVAAFLGPHPGPMSSGWRDRLRRFLAVGVGVGFVCGLVFGLHAVLESLVVYQVDPMLAVRDGLRWGLQEWLFMGVGAGVALDVALRVVRPAAGPVGPANPLLSERLRAFLAVALAAGLTVGIAVMLNNIVSRAGVEFALKAGTEEGLRGGVLTAVVFGFLPSRSGPVTLEFRLHGRLARFLTVCLLTGSLVGVALGLVVALYKEGNLGIPVSAGVLVGLLVGPAIGVVAVCLDTPSVLDRPVNPSSSLRLDRRAALIYSLGYAVAAGAVAWPAYGLDLGAAGYGVISVIVFGIAFYLASFFSTASGRHMIASVWLWLQGRLPLRSTEFLDDAHTRGALRQIGGIYQFRHARLQDRLGSARTDLPAQVR
jgi:hypothetical protein